MYIVRTYSVSDVALDLTDKANPVLNVTAINADQNSAITFTETDPLVAAAPIRVGDNVTIAIERCAASALAPREVAATSPVAVNARVAA